MYQMPTKGGPEGVPFLWGAAPRRDGHYFGAVPSPEHLFFLVNKKTSPFLNFFFPAPETRGVRVWDSRGGGVGMEEWNPRESNLSPKAKGYPGRVP